MGEWDADAQVGEDEPMTTRDWHAIIAAIAWTAICIVVLVQRRGGLKRRGWWR